MTDEARIKIKEILDSPYEIMYPFEIEKELENIHKNVEGNKEEEIKKELLWEIDLLNRTFGHIVIYQGKRIEEISNKWKNILENKEFKPFLDTPFCEWKEEAIEYYKKRYSETSSPLPKARYAFTIMVFSSRQDKLEWMKKSVEEWLKTSEKYINDNVYNKEYYEIPPFSYEFALKLSISFGQKEIAEKILMSLHKNIIKILESGEKRWYLEFLEVESKYINKFKDIDKIKNESIKKIKDIINVLENDFKNSEDKNRSNNFLRHHIEILFNYGVEDKFNLDKEIAESYIKEAEAREEPIIQSAFLIDAIKYYKLMQSKYFSIEAREEINKKIDELTIKIKELNKNIEYEKIGSSISIKKEDIKKILKNLEKGNIFHNLLDDNSVIPKSKQTIEFNEEIRETNLGFRVPNIIFKEDFPIIKHISEEDIFDFRVRKNILIGIKIGGVMIEMILEELKSEYKINILDETKNLISNNPELIDIKDILERGFSYILSERKDFIAGIHIIIPYFEEIVRKILIKAGKKDVVLENKKEKYFRKIELGTLLSDNVVSEIIGEDFQKSLKVLLVDNDQLNLRQDLCHGLLTTDKINEYDSLYVSYCLLKLIFILANIKLKIQEPPKQK